MADAHPNISDLIIDCADPERLKGYETGGFLVMADPEGNEFCIIPKDPFELDDAGRTSYLNNQDLPPKRL
jgi:hypothetical protein